MFKVNNEFNRILIKINIRLTDAVYCDINEKCTIFL